ncbi:MAG: 2-C-methyl-D-erythritol 2,4-cyclodiphosphate synthase [Lachnospiraceae bacterium]|nr:2-C-methyl-D-erythritol 2,4-cyclodiphosphate synthase [Lachnospiraceae bacterium]
MRVSVGQDSHRFDESELNKKCILGGVVFDTAPAFSANSDGDVVLHAVTNAVSGITCRNVLGRRADEMCQAGITDSRVYLRTALDDLEEQGFRPVHLSISIEGKRPAISPRVEEMRASIGALMGLPADCVGITATTGEGLTDCGRGLGVSVFCVLTVE